jgi:uncharacterized protein (TIRG00374 family)
MKKTALTTLKIAVSLGILAVIFSKVDLAKLWEEMRGAKLSYVLASIVVYFIVQALSTYRWYLLLRPLGVRTPYKRLFSFYLLGMYFNFFLPTAIGGDAVRVYYLNKEAQTLSRATASVFLDRDMGMAALLLIATLAALAAGTTFNGVPLAPIFAAIGLAFAAVNLALFYRPTYNLLHRLLSLFKMKRADERVEHLFESVNSYRSQWGLLSAAMGLSILIQVGGVFSNILLAESIGIRTHNGWIDFLVFIPAISLISMNPLSVAGTGWREISYKVLFESGGATQAEALALALMWIGVLIATSLPGGVIYVLQSGRKKEHLPTNDEILGAAGSDATAYPKTEAHQFSALQAKPPEEETVSTI